MNFVDMSSFIHIYQHCLSEMPQLFDLDSAKFSLSRDHIKEFAGRHWSREL